jgi:hypothetical protein
MSSKMRIIAALFMSLAAAIAWAFVGAVYTIELRDGSRILAKDRPHHRGSVMVFHRYPSGVLTSLPEEQVLRVDTEAVEIRNPTLRPGDVVVLGATGAGPASAPPEETVVIAPGTPPGGVYDPRSPAFGYTPPRTLNSNGSFPVFPAGPPSDTTRAVSAEPPTMEPPIGPNGFPATTGIPAEGLAAPEPPTLLVGPDGQPILAPSGAPGSAPPAIGSNGTPTLAPSGAPGSAPPAIGPNGTPVLAPSGAPGSTPPPVGSNGFPARGPG